MADEREISLKIRVEGVSNEASELAKLQAQFKALNEERARFLKEVSSKGIMSNQDKLVLAAYNRDLKQTKDSIKELSTVVDTHEQSVKRMRAEYNKLKDIYYSVDAAAREKMLPVINKLYGEITKAEQAVGVFSRNVGNYPQVMGTAAGGIKELTNAVGGNTAAVGDAITSFATAGGAAGVFTVAMGTLAAAWKRVQENIELYLKSADKLQYSFAGYERDSEKALDDYRKRLRGQEAAGVEAEMKARALLVNRGHLLTEEEKEGLRIQIEKGQNMQTEARTQLNLFHQEVERGKWKMEYNRLLQEEETLNDKKLENETRWEGLEAELIKQRAIVTDQESTAAQKAEAAVQADRIALQLKIEKTAFIDQELASVNAIAEMTGTQEVVEDRVNSLLRERNTIQKEYYSDQVKINRLEKTSLKVDSTGVKMDEKSDAFEERRRSEREKQGVTEMERLEKQYNDEQKAYADFLDKKRQSDEEYAKQKEKWADEEYKKEVQRNKAIEEAAQAHEEAKFNTKNAFTNLIAAIAGKNKTLQKASLIADKGLAVAEIILQTRKANAALLAWGALGGPVGYGFATAARIKNNIAAGVDIAAITVATVAALAGFYKGGRTTKGVPVYTGTPDNLLIAVQKDKEAVINEHQIAALGGTRAMKAAGVPGFYTGGAIGNVPYIQPSPSTQLSNDIQQMSDRIGSLEVHLDMHKVRSGLNELDVTLQPQRI